MRIAADSPQDWESVFNQLAMAHMEGLLGCTVENPTPPFYGPNDVKFLLNLMCSVVKTIINHPQLYNKWAVQTIKNGGS